MTPSPDSTPHTAASAKADTAAPAKAAAPAPSMADALEPAENDGPVPPVADAPIIGPPSLFTEHATRLTRDLITALVSEDDTDTLAQQVADIAGRLSVAAADPYAATLDAPHRVPNHIPHDITPGSSARNPIAPPMRIVPDGDWYRCDLTLPLQYQGPPGRVHGGIVALLIDHLLGHAASMGAEKRSMTRSLTLNYDGGTPIGEPITVRGRISRIEGRKKFMEAQILCDGEVRVRADGLWLLPRES